MRDNEYETQPGFTTANNNGGPDSGSSNGKNAAFEFRATSSDSTQGSVDVEGNTCNMHRTALGVTSANFCYYVDNNIKNSMFRLNQGINAANQIFSVGTGGSNCYAENQIEPGSTDTLYSNAKYTGTCASNSTVQATHFAGGSPTPSITPGSAAGTGAGIIGTGAWAQAGSDTAGVFCLATGTSGVGTGTLVSITYSAVYLSKPFVVISVANDTTKANLDAVYDYADSTTSVAYIVTRSTAPATSTTYCWTYTIFQ